MISGKHIWALLFFFNIYGCFSELFDNAFGGTSADLIALFVLEGPNDYKIIVNVTGNPPTPNCGMKRQTGANSSKWL